MNSLLALYQFYAAVLGPAGLSGVIGQRPGLAEAGSLEAAGGNALGHEGGHHGLSTGLRKLLVMSCRAGVVGVALHAEAQRRGGPQQLYYLSHCRRRFGFYARLVGIEVDVERGVALSI